MKTIRQRVRSLFSNENLRFHIIEVFSSSGTLSLQMAKRKPVHIHPSSSLFHHKPSYVLYNELVLASKCYVRLVDIHSSLSTNEFKVKILLHNIFVFWSFYEFYDWCRYQVCANNWKWHLKSKSSLLRTVDLTAEYAIWIVYSYVNVKLTHLLFCRGVCVVDADWLFDASPEYFKRKIDNR